jgi:hypothetical protein
MILVSLIFGLCDMDRRLNFVKTIIKNSTRREWNVIDLTLYRIKPSIASLSDSNYVQCGELRFRP